jgi:hypothetical protein
MGGNHHLDLLNSQSGWDVKTTPSGGFSRRSVFFWHNSPKLTENKSELRTEQLCEKVQAEVKALHAQGIPPTHHRVRRVLPPGAMRQTKVTATWHEALRELGLGS